MMYSYGNIAMDIPEEAISAQIGNFDEIQEPKNRHMLEDLRDSVVIALELFSLNPHLLEKKDFLERLTNAVIVRVILERKKCFYDA